jgi:hypothetical protein
MLKFLRLYQGWILAIFGTFLVITFLLPQAIQGLFQNAATTGGDWATVGDGEVVSTGQLMELQKELRILELVGNPIINSLGADKDAAYWYLLTREAEQAGMVGGAGVGRTFVGELSRQLGTVSETELVARFMGTAGVNEKTALETIAKISGVSLLSVQFQTAARYSDERLKQAASKIGLAVDADLVILDASSQLTDLETELPSDVALEEQFESHRSELAGTGASGFGYRLPDRARIEWLTIDRAMLEASIEAGSNFDNIEMRKAFMKSPERFGALVMGGGEPPRFEDYEESVRSILTKELVDVRMNEISKFLNDQVQLPRRGVKSVGLHFELPADWNERRADFNELASALGQEFGIDAPTVNSNDSLLTAQELDSLDGIGIAQSTKFGQRPTSVSSYVMSAKEFGGNELIPSQAGVAGPVFTDAARNMYLMRVIDTDPERDPGSLAEVRDLVMTDSESRARFSALEAKIPELEADAATNGMQSVADRFGATVSFQANIAEANPQFLRFGIKSPTRVASLRDSTTLVERVLEKAASLDFMTLTTDIPAEKRTFFVADEESLAVIGVQITSIKPLTEESWDELAASDSMIRVLATDETAVDFSKTFSFEELKSRHDFKLLAVNVEGGGAPTTGLGAEDETAEQDTENTSASTTGATDDTKAAG